MQPQTIQNQSILFCVLDWGMGHATRSSVLISRLIAQNNSITLFASDITIAYLKQLFPSLVCIAAPSYGIQYYRYLPAGLSIALQISKIRRCIKLEHQMVKNILQKNKFDLVISDSRYGCFNANVHSVFISHQLFLKSPVFSKWLNRNYVKYLEPFSTIWVPDLEGDNNLSGDLAHRQQSFPFVLKTRTHYIQPLSRFDAISKAEKRFDLIFILSGPEPLRTVFENQVLQYVNSNKGNYALIRGINTRAEMLNVSVNLETHSILNVNELGELISNANAIVCRSGYSSIMDYYQLSITKYILPTPGQTEQLYLANHLNGRCGFVKINSINELPITIRE
jgi:uncharacterized protein (TIGR00661 family)